MVQTNSTQKKVVLVPCTGEGVSSTMRELDEEVAAVVVVVVGVAVVGVVVVVGGTLMLVDLFLCFLEAILLSIFSSKIVDFLFLFTLPIK